MVRYFAVFSNLFEYGSVNIYNCQSPRWCDLLERTDLFSSRQRKWDWTFRLQRLCVSFVNLNLMRFSRAFNWESAVLSGPFSLAFFESEVAQSCPTLCDPMDCSLPGSSVHGIFWAGVLEWGAISSLSLEIDKNSTFLYRCFQLEFQSPDPLSLRNWQIYWGRGSGGEWLSTC